MSAQQQRTAGFETLTFDVEREAFERKLCSEKLYFWRVNSWMRKTKTQVEQNLFQGRVKHNDPMRSSTQGVLVQLSGAAHQFLIRSLVRETKATV